MSVKPFIYLICIASIGGCGPETTNSSNKVNNGGSNKAITGSTPFAIDDAVTAEQNSAINISVLENDTGLSDTPISIDVLSEPAYGTAIRQDDNTITYLPNSNFSGSDNFSYSITDADGDIATASVSVATTCSNCPTNTRLKLSWYPNPIEENIEGYKIYFGSSLLTATNQINDLSISQMTFDINAPSIEYYIADELALIPGDSVCFRLKAYNSTGLSAYSAGTCSIIQN